MRLTSSRSEVQRFIRPEPKLAIPAATSVVYSLLTEPKQNLLGFFIDTLHFMVDFKALPIGGAGGCKI